MLVRFLKRRSSRELKDPEQLREAEFRQKDGSYDLRLSTYLIKSGEFSRCCAEHMATAPRVPEDKPTALDLCGVQVTREHTPGNQYFAFTQKAHYELILDGVDGLAALARLVIEVVRVPRIETTKREVRTYASEMVEQGDPEWLGLRLHPRVEEIRKWVSGL